MKARLVVLAAALFAVMVFANVASAHNGSIQYACGEASVLFKQFAAGNNTVRLYYSVDFAPEVKINRTFNGTSSTRSPHPPPTSRPKQ